MKFFVADKEKEFFAEKGLLLLEDIFSPHEIDDLRLAAEAHAQSGGFKDLALLEKCGQARDILFSPKLAQLAFTLSGGSFLRYGYDFFFRLSAPPQGLFLSVSPLTIGACVALESTEEGETPPVIPFTLRNNDLPMTKGSVLFFSPKTAFSLEATPLSIERSFLLLLYAGRKAQYTFQPDDPHTHDLKRLGYVFGDNLHVATHPFLYR